VNYDRVFFGISPDGGTFYGWQWDGTANWQAMRFGLDSYLGDASVWVGWLLESDSTVQYEGPWVDDILIRKYVPGQVTVRGSFFYADRSNNPVPARFTKVYLYDQDPGGAMTCWTQRLQMPTASSSFRRVPIGMRMIQIPILKTTAWTCMWCGRRMSTIVPLPGVG
jgi:hypothetical protein